MNLFDSGYDIGPSEDGVRTALCATKAGKVLTETANPWGIIFMEAR